MPYFVCQPETAPTSDPMASNFHCIIRIAGTTGPEGIWSAFFCNTVEEGKAKLAAEWAQVDCPGYIGGKLAEVQIFDLRD